MRSARSPRPARLTCRSMCGVYWPNENVQDWLFCMANLVPRLARVGLDGGEGMPARMEIGALAPAAYKAMAGLDAFVRNSALPKPLLELVRLRASQINGCAYCVDMHSTDAKAGGESDARLFAVAAWQEGPVFAEQERAALALTESMT